MNTQENPSSGWVPEFMLDLETATSQKFQEVIKAFDASTVILGENLPPLPFSQNGWYDINPETSEIILRRNRPGSNREISFATSEYYWRQMKDDTWMPTGQPIILDVKGHLNDGQHRLWAAYLGLKTFKTYIIIDAPIIPQVFAYLDNVRARTPAAALQTAKFNGMSSVVAQVIQISNNYDLGVYTCHKVKHAVRMTPIHYLHYAESHPGIREAARLVVGDHREAIQLIGDKGLTAFLAYKISTLYGEDVTERFLDELVYPEGQTQVLAALNTFLVKQSKTDEPLAKHQVLATLIKGFNAWITGTPLKRVSVHVDDPFPQFSEPEKTEPEDDETQAAA